MKTNKYGLYFNYKKTNEQKEWNTLYWKQLRIAAKLTFKIDRLNSKMKQE